MNIEAKTQKFQSGYALHLFVCLQREYNCLQDAIELLYGDRLTLEIGDLHASLRYGGLSCFRQLNAALSKVCFESSLDLEEGIKKHELAVLLPELDRRYFIIQGAKGVYSPQSPLK